MHFNGLHFEKSQAAAFDLILRTADKGHPRGKSTAGKMLISGDGVEKNEVMGIGYILASLSNDHDGLIREPEQQESTRKLIDKWIQEFGVAPGSILFALDRLSQKDQELIRQARAAVRTEEIQDCVSAAISGYGISIMLAGHYRLYCDLTNKIAAIIRVRSQDIHAVLQVEFDLEKKQEQRTATFHVAALSGQRTAEVTSVIANPKNMYSRIDTHVANSYPGIEKAEVTKKLSQDVRSSLLAHDKIAINELATLCGLLVSEKSLQESKNIIVLRKDNIDILQSTEGRLKQIENLASDDSSARYRLIIDWLK
ncbi:hypothetical protein DC094_19340 [Pelagibaculum spongiae]|uniref:Uncharacterized protein n=2 Tax=Pelagibaculum spongiae TaxID=2080658 RepID=A0A2V1GVP2_9GAMM|nr:hypothetical protein DC094_19340 [Pelagibaculum spongiae]